MASLPRGLFVSISLLCSLLVCPALAQPASFALTGRADDLKLVDAVDMNPDPHIVEINLSARVSEVDVNSGTKVEAWTYNGAIPGPLIRARVGDRLIVHFENAL